MTQGREPNAFYLPSFISRLHRLANEFSLWTGVAVPCSPHATSSYVEEYFNDLKTRVFTAVKLPARLDIFLKELARNTEGETKLFLSKLKKSQEQAQSDRIERVEQQIDFSYFSYMVRNEPFVEIPSSNACIDLDLWSQENWRTKAPPPKNVDDFTESDSDAADLKGEVLLNSIPTLKTVAVPLETNPMIADPNKPKYVKTSKFFGKYPEIRQRNMQTTKRIKPRLLPNGIRCRKGVKINDEIVFVKNTCAFDSLVQILLTRAIDNTNYSAFIEKSENSLLQFVCLFMMNGVTPDILRKRV